MLRHAAHLGAAAEAQTRAWLPVPRFVCFFSCLREDADEDTEGEDDDEAAVGRVSGDSRCSRADKHPPTSSVSARWLIFGLTHRGTGECLGTDRLVLLGTFAGLVSG